MDTTRLDVRIHAIKQFMRRLEGKPVPDNYHLGDELQRRYSREILKRIAGGFELPASYCTLFVRVSRGGHVNHQRALRNLARGNLAAGTTSWGTYIYDGEAVFVINNQAVVTVIWPTMGQYETLEAIGQERRLIESPPDDLPSLPAEPWPVELANLDGWNLEDILAWINRAKPAKERMVRLLSDIGYSREIIPALPPDLRDAAELRPLPPEFIADANYGTHLRDCVGQHSFRRAILNISRSITHVFVLCGSSSATPVIQAIGQLVNAELAMGPQWERGRKKVCGINPGNSLPFLRLKMFEKK